MCVRVRGSLNMSIIAQIPLVTAATKVPGTRKCRKCLRLDKERYTSHPARANLLRASILLSVAVKPETGRAAQAPTDDELQTYEALLKPR